MQGFARGHAALRADQDWSPPLAASLHWGCKISLQATAVLSTPAAGTGTTAHPPAAMAVAEGDCGLAVSPSLRVGSWARAPCDSSLGT